MAFESAAGYNNLPNGVFSPTIYSKKVLTTFRKKSVAEDLVNSQYFGEIANYGDSVRIMKEPEITVTDYARGTQVTPQDLQDSDFTLIIDRAKAFSFKVDDIEVQQSHVNWMELASDRAAYKVAETYDADILGYMSGYQRNDATGVWTARSTAVGTKARTEADADELLAIHKMGRNQFVSAGAATDSIVVGTSGTFDATPVQVINRMARLLDEQNVPSENRWLIVDPVFMEKLMDENSKFMNQFYQKSEQLSNGKLSSDKIYGFRIYRSNNLPKLGTGPSTVDADGSATNFGVLIAGHDGAVASASQINKTEKFRDTQSFADVVRGLHLYGRKIIRPEGLIRAAYNVNA